MSEFKPSVVEKDSISVILTGFKRDNFDLQIQSIKQQTIQPKNIFIYQDEEHVDLNKYRKQGIKLIQSKDFNFGCYFIIIGLGLVIFFPFLLLIFDEDTSKVIFVGMLVYLALRLYKKFYK